MKPKRTTPKVLGLLLVSAFVALSCNPDPDAVLLAQSSTTLVSDTPDPSVPGQPVTVVYTVSGLSDPQPPTGNVLVTDGNAHTCQAAVAAGQCAVVLPGSGTFTLTATYLGDSHYAPSADQDAHTVVAIGTTASVTTIVADAPDPSLTGQNVTVSWTVAPLPPATGTPTGTVTVNAGGGETCSASVAAGSCTLSFATTGGKTLTATYSGDAIFASSSDTEAHAVDKGATTLRITADTPDPSMLDQAVQVSWTLTPTAPASGTPGGDVTVSVGAASCTAPVASGSCSVAPATSGAVTLTATYAGDANFLGSADTENHQVRTPLFEAGNPAPGPLTVSMQPGPVTGSRITIRIMATDTNDFFGAAFRVNFDPSILTFDSADTTGSFLRDAAVATQFSVNGTSVPGSVLVGATRVDAGANDGVDVVGTRELLTLTFQVRGVPAAAGSAVTFGDPKEVRDSVQPPPEGNLIVVTWIGGTVKGQ